MKRKNLENDDTNQFSFKNLVDKLKTINPDGILVSENRDMLRIDNWINTGNYMLNAIISGSIFKGVPEGRITVFSGESGTGKSFACLNLARAAQKQGYKIIWLDSESAIDDETFVRFGIELENVLYVPINTINETSTYLSNLVDSLNVAKEEGKSIDKYVVILDSLGNLSTDKEMRDTTSGSAVADMTRAREIKKLFRVCTKKLGSLKIPMIITNHVYANIASFTGGHTMSGGSGIIYNASTVVEFSKAQLKEDGMAKPKTCIIVTAKLPKSRFTKSNKSISFHISFQKGMNPYVGLENYFDWDACGVAYGKYEKGVFTPSTTGRTLAVKHLNKHISPKKMFTPQVLTQEVLEKLDPIIREEFELPISTGLDYEVSDLLDFDENDEKDESSES